MRKALFKTYLPLSMPAGCFVLALLLAMLPANSFAQGTCLAGSGSCSDGFNGQSGAPLSTYSSSWVKIFGSADAYMTGSGAVAIPGRSFAYYSYAHSASDTSQILVMPSRTTGNYAREACVRLTTGQGGYCVGFGSVSGGNYYGCYVEKAGQYLGSASCGAITATDRHTLAITATGSHNTSLQIYLDGALTGTVIDYGSAFTSTRSGFALIGDGDATNSYIGAWQDFPGTLSAAIQLSAAAPIFGCANGSGTCFDTFAGTASRLLPDYNNLWVKARGNADAYLTGSQSVQLPGNSFAYYYNQASTSDTAQITVNPSSATQAYAREACVRIQPNAGGYCVGFGGVSGGVYNGCYLEKSGGYAGNGNCGNLSATVPHILSITASGSFPVALQLYVDGIPMGAIYDSTNVYKASHPGFGLISGSTPADTDAGTWRDYRETIVATAPSFQPAAGSYNTAQSVVMSSTKSGAVMHYTTDGSTPTALSPTYNAPLNLATSTTIKAIAMAAGQATSPVATAAYQINLPLLSSPSFTVPTPYSGVSANVGIINAAAGSQLLYCLDIATPALQACRI